MYKIGVIGTGIIGHTHLRTISQSDECEIAAVVDVNPEKAESAAKEYGVPFYTDYKEIKESIDAVIINLPHFLHCEVSCYFLGKGIHVLCEKPMATSVSECVKMKEAADKNGAKLAIGHVQRFFGANEVLRNMYKEEKFGKLAMINERRNTNYFSESRPRWFLDKKLAGGGIMMNYGAHGLDKLFTLMGDTKITSLHANCGNLLDGYDVEGHAQVYLEFENGISSVMTYSAYSDFEVNETTYYFRDGAVRVYNSNNIEIATNGKFEPYEFTEEYPPFVKQLHQFVRYIEGKESTIPTPEFGTRVIETIKKVYGEN